MSNCLDHHHRLTFVKPHQTVIKHSKNILSFTVWCTRETNQGNNFGWIGLCKVLWKCDLNMKAWERCRSRHSTQTNWGQVTHICVGKLTITGSDNGLSPRRYQAIIRTNAGILLIGPLETNVSEFVIGIQTFSFRKMHLKMSSAKWRPFCVGPNVLNQQRKWQRQFQYSIFHDISWDHVYHFEWPNLFDTGDSKLRIV